MFLFSVVLAAENRNISVIEPRVTAGVVPGAIPSTGGPRRNAAGLKL
jgi:hypothetical protein